ncbi:MAG: peptidylprolyl isomerase [Gammaproteobacteria bacterium]
MQYSLCNTEGVVVREASGAPVTYLHGAGVLFEKLEKALENCAVGDIKSVRLLPDDAFGKRDIELVCAVPLSEFPPGETIETGGQVTGTDHHGAEVTFTVTDIRDEVAHLDGNHPLAGQSLVFEVEIQAIRAASEEEIRQATVLA